MEGEGSRLVLPPSGVCDGGGGFDRGRDLHIPSPEHSNAIYCDWGYYVPVSGGKA